MFVLLALPVTLGSFGHLVVSTCIVIGFPSAIMLNFLLVEPGLDLSMHMDKGAKSFMPMLHFSLACLPHIIETLAYAIFVMKRLKPTKMFMILVFSLCDIKIVFLRLICVNRRDYITRCWDYENAKNIIEFYFVKRVGN